MYSDHGTKNDLMHFDIVIKKILKIMSNVDKLVWATHLHISMYIVSWLHHFGIT